MTTDFALLRWKAEGLRCPDHEIKIANTRDTPNRLTLLQMPNGTGKTTALTLLRATLSGEATEWTAEDVRALRKKESDSSTGTFLVECTFDEKRLTVVLELDFEEGRASYSTTYGQGKKVGFHPPTALRRFLQKDFVRLFIFDGEQAERLLDHRHTNAHDAIDSLFQLKFFDGMQKRVAEYWEAHMDQVKAGDEKGLARRRNRVAFLTQRLAQCKDDYAIACANRDRFQEQLDKKRRKFKEQIKAHKQFSDDLRNAENILNAAKAQVQINANDVLSRFRDPYALLPSIGQRIMNLRVNLDRVKLPESTAREFFVELADEDECVCGRVLDQVCREHIRSQASRYLGSDDVSLLNAMKSDISDLVGDEPNIHSAHLTGQIHVLKDCIRTENEARTNKDMVESQAVQADPQLEQINEEIDALQASLDEATGHVEKFESTEDSLGDEQTCGIVVLERRLKDAERKLAEITETLDLRCKRDTLEAILGAAHELARASIGRETVQKANERIASLMPSNRIRIKDIGNCLVLEGQEGGSMGETLSVAYAFLATFFNSASNRFPFIVDSPAGAIDLAIRPRIAELVPKLTNQFVAFTISSERQGFCDRLAKSEKKAVFLTLFRKGERALDKQARAIKGCVETSDALLVPGYEFFEQFQIDSE